MVYAVRIDPMEDFSRAQVIRYGQCETGQSRQCSFQYVRHDAVVTPVPVQEKIGAGVKILHLSECEFSLTGLILPKSRFRMAANKQRYGEHSHGSNNES